MKFPVFKAIAATAAYLVMHALTVVKTLWLPALALHAGLIYVMPGYLDGAMKVSALDPIADQAEILALAGPLYASLGLLLLMNAVFYPMMIAGGLRHIIRGESPRLPFYLQLGADEFRIMITFIILVVMLCLVYFIGVVGVLALGAALTALAPAIGATVATVLFAAVIIAFVWFLLRMSVVFPATIGARKIGLAQSWAVTKGNAWGLFFYWALWVIVMMLIASVYMMIAWPEYLALFGEAMRNASDPAAMKEGQLKMMQSQRDVWDMSKPGFWPGAIATYIYLIVYVALWNAASGIAYRYLSGEQARA